MFSCIVSLVFVLSLLLMRQHQDHRLGCLRSSCCIGEKVTATVGATKTQLPREGGRLFMSHEVCKSSSVGPRVAIQNDTDGTMTNI